MSELNDEDYFPPVTELEDDENEECPGDDGPPKYLSDCKELSNTQDGIPSQEKNRLGGKILAVWERYKPLLEHYYSRAGYMMSMDTKTYAHEKVGVLYIYLNDQFMFLEIIILKRI